MNPDHKHTFAAIIRKDGESELLTQPVTQVNGGDNITTFHYCPECGEANEFCVLLTSAHWEYVLADTTKIFQRMWEYKSRLEKHNISIEYPIRAKTKKNSK